jgi:pimeloyl-ACP methyl ester carboxylesterase
MAKMKQFTRNNLVFDVGDEGREDGDVIVLLHGYPETKESWDGVVPALTDAGYRVLAPDQRGYSPGARPRGRWAYRQTELVADVLALADAADASRFHVVGHDWGGAVAWGLGMWHPDRVKTLSVLSTPHPRAFLRSMVTSSQALHSWYMFFYQLPLIPDLSALGPSRRIFRRTLVRSGLPEHAADRYIARLGGRRAMASIINWYRAMPFTAPRRYRPVSVPTMYVYSTGDFALGRKAADLTERYVTGPYRYEVLDGVSHWIPEERPAEVARLLLDHVRSGG